jgi:hypothetical protein
MPFRPQFIQPAFYFESDLTANCQPGGNGVGVETRHDPGWHGYF